MPRSVSAATPLPLLLGALCLLALGLSAGQAPRPDAAGAPDAGEPAHRPQAEDIGPILDRLVELRPVRVPGRGGDGSYVLRPEEVAALFPEAVTAEGAGSGKVDYDQIAVLAVQAVRELAARSAEHGRRLGEEPGDGPADLARRLAALERQNADLRRGLEEARRPADTGDLAARLDRLERENADLRRELASVSGSLGNPSPADRTLGLDNRIDELEREDKSLRSGLGRLEREIAELERRIRD